MCKKSYFFVSLVSIFIFLDIFCMELPDSPSPHRRPLLHEQDAEEKMGESKHAIVAQEYGETGVERRIVSLATPEGQELVLGVFRRKLEIEPSPAMACNLVTIFLQVCGQLLQRVQQIPKGRYYDGCFCCFSHMRKINVVANVEIPMRMLQESSNDFENVFAEKGDVLFVAHVCEQVKGCMGSISRMIDHKYADCVRDDIVSFWRVAAVPSRTDES